MPAVLETRTVVTKIACRRCGHAFAPVKKYKRGGQSVTWCDGCGEWQAVPNA